MLFSPGMTVKRPRPVAPGRLEIFSATWSTTCETIVISVSADPIPNVHAFLDDEERAILPADAYGERLRFGFAF